MTRRGWLGAAAMVAGAVAWVGVAGATGFGGDSPPARIPVPAKVYQATVEDRTGNRLTLQRVSWNGEVFVYGELGAAQVTVPFDKIREASVEDGGGEGKRVVVVTTLDGQTVRVTVDDDLLCYGKTEFGNYQIEVMDIRKITAISLVSPRPPSD
jgi:hypothetical protein